MNEKINEGRKQKQAYIWASLTLLATAFIGYLILNSSDQVLPIFLGGLAILFGPITGLLYVMEVKKGVFKIEDDDE